MSEAQLRYGPWLLQLRHPVLLEFLKKEEKVKQQILQSLEGQDTEASAQRRLEVQADLAVIEEALGYFKQGEKK
jgi:tRNA (adenine22-N1)-methyltransferase